MLKIKTFSMIVIRGRGRAGPFFFLGPPVFERIANPCIFAPVKEYQAHILPRPVDVISLVLSTCAEWQPYLHCCILSLPASCSLWRWMKEPNKTPFMFSIFKPTSPTPSCALHLFWKKIIESKYVLRGVCLQIVIFFKTNSQKGRIVNCLHSLYNVSMQKMFFGKRTSQILCPQGEHFEIRFFEFGISKIVSNFASCFCSIY